MVLIMTARLLTSSRYDIQVSHTNTTVLLFTLHPNQFVSIFTTKVRLNNYDGGIKYSKMFVLLRFTSTVLVTDKGTITTNSLCLYGLMLIKFPQVRLL